MANILKETSQLIDFKGRIFVINTLLLSIIFLTINFFGVVRYNIVNIENYLENNQQIRVLLKEGVSPETVKLFEEELSKDPKIAFHAFGAKELTIKSLENRINLDITENNALRDHMAIFFGDVDSISEAEVYIDKLSKREFTERVLFNKELFEKILNTKKTFEYIRKGTMNFFIVPLYFLVFLVFRLNFVNYEEEIFHKYLNKKNNFMAILPYYIKKVINILLAWCISYTIFSIFYTKVESLLFVLNPNINFVLFENLPKITFIIPIIVSTVLMLFASLFIKKGGSKR